MTAVRFLNGLDTIGGNIVEISTENSRVIMDFGVAVSNDRPDATTEELIAEGVLPNLPDLLLDQPNQFEAEAIFISHLHIDHMGALQFLNKDIPIYLSKEAYDLYQLLLKSDLEVLIPHPERLQALTYNEPVVIGDIAVTGYESDHDTIGAMALLTKTPDLTVGYSGDVRLNGPHPERVKRWAKIFKSEKLDLLLLEGTSYSFEQEGGDIPITPHLTEQTLQTQFRNIIMQQALPFIPVINFYPRNVERMKGFNDTAASIRRKLVLEPNYAKILHHFYPDLPIYVLSETPINDYIEIKLSDLQAHPENFILQNSFEHLEFLDAFSQVSYIMSNGEPLGDYDPRFKQFTDFISDHHFPIAYFPASGHATRDDLLKIAQTVDPRVIVPWHSFKPEIMANALKPVSSAELLLPEKELYYEF